MNSRFKVIVVLIVCGAALSLGACSREEPAPPPKDAASVQPLPTAQEPAASAAQPASGAVEETTTGKLLNVDLTAETIVVKDAEGNDQTFSFSASTQIVGVPDAQGLTGEQGNEVVIRHVLRDGKKQAVRIEITPK
jgi:hypothetical protein